MREILFRGKNAKGEWQYGVPLITGLNSEIAYITQANSYDYRVDIDTIGQYTGLTDNNGKKIFEGDVVKVEGFLELAFAVIYYNGGFKLKEIDSEDLFAYYITESMVEEELIEVIGNIHDNLELQKGGEGRWLNVAKKDTCKNYDKKCSECWAMSSIYDTHPCYTRKDLVEVVRCKDCKYFKHFERCGNWCHRRIQSDIEYRVRLNDYCSYGVRTPQKDV